MTAAGNETVLETRTGIANAVERVCLEAPLPVDVHTHLYSARFGDLLLWGFDELVTYHYLIAEVCRTNRAVSPDQFYAMSKREQADHVWQSLFIDESPVSEARRGVLTCLQAYGLDVEGRDIEEYREFFASTTVEEHIDRVFKMANCEKVVMTNDPFNDTERAIWLAQGAETDERFLPALRIDPLLVTWHEAQPRLAEWGYDVHMDLGGDTLAEVRRFLMDWGERMDPVYMAASLGFNFSYPDHEHPSTPIIDEAIAPACVELGIPFSPMLGVKRQVNPALELAGDAVGKCDIGTVERLCRSHPDCNFFVTLLSRENQHELCVAARKFPNLMPFGCWWFLNDPSIIDEITRERVELLGLSFVAQHSDCRILDQLVYKWRHSRRSIAEVLTDKYIDIFLAGWRPTVEQIEADVRGLLGQNFLDWAGL
ncbi:MAG: glucuronate isomerase [Armatimonadota bacterium]|nr:glucuronate isomerase [Armatimonadota bacterium]